MVAVGASALSELPEPSTDQATTIDQLDAWLIAADAPLTPRRRPRRPSDGALVP